jgi:hypothetical protein
MARNNTLKADLSGNPAVSQLKYHIFDIFATTALIGTRKSGPNTVHVHRTEIVRRKSRMVRRKSEVSK